MMVPFTFWRYPFSSVLMPKYPNMKSFSGTIAASTLGASFLISSVTMPASYKMRMASVNLAGAVFWMLLATMRVASIS